MGYYESVMHVYLSNFGIGCGLPPAQKSIAFPIQGLHRSHFDQTQQWFLLYATMVHQHRCVLIRCSHGHGSTDEWFKVWTRSYNKTVDLIIRPFCGTQQRIAGSCLHQLGHHHTFDVKIVVKLKASCTTHALDRILLKTVTPFSWIGVCFQEKVTQRACGIWYFHISIDLFTILLLGGQSVISMDHSAEPFTGM